MNVRDHGSPLSLPPPDTPHREGGDPGPPAASASVIASQLPDLPPNLLPNLLTPRPAAKKSMRADECQNTGTVAALPLSLPPPDTPPPDTSSHSSSSAVTIIPRFSVCDRLPPRPLSLFPVLLRSPSELCRYPCGSTRTLPRSEAMKLIKSLNLLLVAALLALAFTSGAEAHEKGDKKEGKLPPGVERPPKAEGPPKAERLPGWMKPSKDGSKEAHLNKPPGWTKPPMADRPPGMGSKKGASETKPPGWTKPPKADSPPKVDSPLRADRPPMADRPAHKKGPRRSAM
eukprot:gene18737-25268_t